MNTNTPETPTAGQDSGEIRAAAAEVVKLVIADAPYTPTESGIRETLRPFVADLLRERDELKAEVERLTHSRNHWEDQTKKNFRLYERSRQELDRLRAENAELLKDKARLDWLERDAFQDEPVGIEYRDGQFRFPYLVSNAGGFGGGVAEANFDTLRAAIDANLTKR